MALSDLILFPYIPQDIYDLYKKSNKVTVKDLISLDKELKRLFLTAKSKNRLCQCILYDFYLTVNHEVVYKDNITGKRIEQRLSKMFALSTGDELSKSNPTIETLLQKEDYSLFSDDVQDLICSNYREKGDLFFYDSRLNIMYKLSIKSLVPDNDEINFGAFEFQSTIKGIPEIEALLNLQERNRKKIHEVNGIGKEMGLGSGKQMSPIIDYIKSKGKLDEYIKRFRILLSGVYKDDFLIYIKDNNKFKLCLVQNSVFIDLVTNRIIKGFKNMRMEGNSLRLTGVGEFFDTSYSSYILNFTECIPEMYEIERLLVNANHSKLGSLRNFINNSPV